MFSRFIEWVDSWNDRINPIAVRDLYRLKRWFGLEGMTLIVLLGMVGAYIAVFGIASDESFVRVGSNRWHPGNIISTIILCISFYGMIVAAFTPIGWLMKSRQTDELFEAVPLSPREQVEGYLQSTWILVIFFVALCFPFLVAARLIGPCSNLLLLVPFYSVLIATVAMLFILSFVIPAQKNWQAVFVILGILYIGSGIVLSPAIAAAILWEEVFHWPELHWNRGFGMFSLFVLLPVGLILFGYVAYRLSVYHWKRSNKSSLLKTVLVKPLWNIVVYTGTVLAETVVYLLLAATVYWLDWLC